MFSYSPFHTFPFSKSDATAAVVPNIELNALDLIASFYVTCPRLAKKEEEEYKRILFYYPNDESPKRKVNTFKYCLMNFLLQAEITGMSSAVVGFTSELMRLEKINHVKQRRKHRFIWSTKTASIVLPVEDDFIIGVTFNR